MSETVSHNCGICVTHTLHDAHAFIETLQHRGRDATGIAAIGKDRIDVIKWMGTVDKVDQVDLHKVFPSSEYHTFMAHVRYATKGTHNESLEEAHPHVIGGQTHHNGNHVLITDCEFAAVHNGQVDTSYLTDIDISATNTGCDSEAFLHYFKKNGERTILREIPGSYTVAIAQKGKDAVVVMRDRAGIRPGVLGWKDGKYVVASEDIALRKNGGELIEDLEPGAAYYLNASGTYRKTRYADPIPAHCFFEWNYISHRDTILEGIYVKTLRRALGEMLAEELCLDNIELVSYFPRAPEDAARSYAKAAKKEFRPLFYKLRGERAFQGPSKNERRQSINMNLYLMPNAVHDAKGKAVLVIEDSIVRGSNFQHERELMNRAGVSDYVHMSYTPPIGIIGDDGEPRGCLFGVDMPPTDDFFARNRTPEQINEESEVTVGYITVEGMLKVFEKLGMPRSHLCTFCIGGQHPFSQPKRSIV